MPLYVDNDYVEHDYVEGGIIKLPDTVIVFGFSKTQTFIEDDKNSAQSIKRSFRNKFGQKAIIIPRQIISEPIGN